MTQPSASISCSSLLPLHSAVRLVYAGLYHARWQDTPVSRERLAGIAQLMVALVPVYAPDAAGAARRLTEHELKGARARRSGSELFFSDGRSPIAEVYVSRTGVDHVIQMLSLDTDEPERPPFEPPHIASSVGSEHLP